MSRLASSAPATCRRWRSCATRWPANRAWIVKRYSAHDIHALDDDAWFALHPAGQGADPGTHGEAVHPRHADVEEDAVRTLRLECAERFRDGRPHDGLVALVLESGPGQGAILRVVVDDQDLGRGFMGDASGLVPVSTSRGRPSDGKVPRALPVPVLRPSSCLSRPRAWHTGCCHGRHEDEQDHRRC